MLYALTTLTTYLRARLEPEDGFSTAELVGNAALGIVALVAIWVALQALGLDIVEWMRTELLGQGPAAPSGGASGGISLPDASGS